MAYVTINLSAGTVITSPVIIVRESSEPLGSTNRYVSGTVPGEIRFNAIQDNQSHRYIVDVTDSSGTCKYTTQFDFTQDCASKPTGTFTTNCNTYNSSTGTVSITANPVFNSSTQVRLIINDGSTVVVNQLINSGVGTSFTVPANKLLTTRIEDPSYPACALSQSYVASCAVDCNLSFTLGTNTCGTVNVTITDANPAPYTISVKAAGDNTERFVSITNGVITFTPVNDGTNKTYTVTITKQGCTAVSKTFQRMCGGCDMSGYSLYRIKYSNYAITSMADACANYCNGAVISGIAGYLNNISVGGFAFTSNYNCTPITPGYGFVFDFNQEILLGVIHTDSNGQIIEYQPACNCGNPTLQGNVDPVNPTCNNGTLGNGSIIISSASSANKYSYTEGSTYTGSNDCNSATTLTNGNATITITGLQQGVNKTYTVRIWNTASGCSVYRDYTISLTVPICCVTYDVNTQGNSSTTVNYVDCSGNNQSEVVSGSNVHKYVCAKSGSVTVTGTATVSVYNANTCNPPSQGCSLTFQRNNFTCVGTQPKVQYLLFGGTSSSDYQFQIGNGGWQDTVANIAEYLGSDGASVTVNFRLKSNNSCIKSDTFTFTTNCNTGTGCSKPSVSGQYLGSPAEGVSYSSASDACANGCFGSPAYRDYYAASLTIGNKVYNSGNNSPNDCSTPVDGWYIGITNVYRIQGGNIVETAPHCFNGCGEAAPTLGATSNPINIPSGTDPNTVYTITVTYTCTTVGVKVYKNGSFWKQLPQNTHSFTFTASEVNDGDYITARTNCGSMEGSESNRINITKPGTTPVDPICNFGSSSDTGGYVIKSIPATPQTITFSGTVYYMLDSGGVPDQITAYKNGSVFQAHYGRSYRVAGAIPVIPGDTIQFKIDATVTNETATGWTFYMNCNTPYDVNGSYPPYTYQNNDFPTVNFVSGACLGSSPRFNVNASNAVNGGYSIVGWKAINITKGDHWTFAGTPSANPSGSAFPDGGWFNSSTITKDSEGRAINATDKYVIFVKDNRPGPAQGIASLTGITGVSC